MQDSTTKPVALSYVDSSPAGDTKRIRDFHAECARLAIADQSSPYTNREHDRYTQGSATCERCGKLINEKEASCLR